MNLIIRAAKTPTTYRGTTRTAKWVNAQGAVIRTTTLIDGMVIFGTITMAR